MMNRPPDQPSPGSWQPQQPDPVGHESAEPSLEWDHGADAYPPKRGVGAQAEASSVEDLGEHRSNGGIQNDSAEESGSRNAEPKSRKSKRGNSKRSSAQNADFGKNGSESTGNSGRSKRYWWIGVFVAVVVLALAAVAILKPSILGFAPAGSQSPGPADTSTESTTPPQPPSTAEPSDDDPQQSPVPPQAADDWETPSPAAFGHPLRLHLGEFEVSDLEVGLPTYGDALEKRTAQGQFIKLNVSYTSLEEVKSSPSDALFVLITTDYLEYSPATLTTSDSFRCHDISQNESCGGTVIFDIPLDRAPSAIRVFEMREDPFKYYGAEMLLTEQPLSPSPTPTSKPTYEKRHDTTIGRPITVPDFAIVTVLDVTPGITTIGASPNIMESAKGQFVAVNIRIENLTTVPLDTLKADFVLRLDDSTHFTPIPGTSEIENALGSSAKIGPAMSLEGTLYYDVPPGVALANLAIKGRPYNETTTTYVVCDISQA